MFVMTDEDNKVLEVAFIPGMNVFPAGYKCYFPVKEALPNVGDTFIPNFELQPWLRPQDNL